MVNFNWHLDDDSVWYKSDWRGGADDHAWDNWAWSETRRELIWLVDDADALSTTIAGQLRGCA
eukprot:8566833-Lingulodinium_polyedra.AAC.1